MSVSPLQVAASDRWDPWPRQGADTDVRVFVLPRRNLLKYLGRVDALSIRHLSFRHGTVASFLRCFIAVSLLLGYSSFYCLAFHWILRGFHSDFLVLIGCFACEHNSLFCLLLLHYANVVLEASFLACVTFVVFSCLRVLFPWHLSDFWRVPSNILRCSQSRPSLWRHPLRLYISGENTH